jgi:hypothetical protein
VFSAVEFGAKHDPPRRVHWRCTSTGLLRLWRSRLGQARRADLCGAAAIMPFPSPLSWASEWSPHFVTRSSTFASRVRPGIMNGSRQAGRTHRVRTTCLSLHPMPARQIAWAPSWECQRNGHPKASSGSTPAAAKTNCHTFHSTVQRLTDAPRFQGVAKFLARDPGAARLSQLSPYSGSRTAIKLIGPTTRIPRLRPSRVAILLKRT